MKSCKLHKNNLDKTLFLDHTQEIGPNNSKYVIVNYKFFRNFGKILNKKMFLVPIIITNLQLFNGDLFDDTVQRLD